MSAGRWVPAPRQFPAKCAFTGLSSREHGPYLEVDMGPGRPYVEPISRREGRMYWSFVSWRTTVTDPDGPYAALIEEVVEARTEKLQKRIAELERKLAADPVREALDGIQEKISLPGHLAQTREPRPLPRKKPAKVTASAPQTTSESETNS